MRFVGNRSKQWSGYVILALAVVAAWLTRNRPRYRSRFPYTTNTPYGGTTSTGQNAGRARVYDTDRARAAATATAATAGAARVYDRAEDPSSYLTRRLEPEEVDRYRNRRRGLWLLPLLLLLLVGMCAATLLGQRGVRRSSSSDGTAPATTPAVQVDPQPAGNTLTVNRVVAPQDGWVALYRADANGQPDLNAPVGAAPVAAGERADVPVPLNQPVVPGEQLAAVLHADNGVSGTFEPNGADAPLTTNGSTVVSTFPLQAAAGVVAAAGTGAQTSSPPQPLASSSPQVAENTAAGAATSPAASASTPGENGTIAGQNALEAATSDATSTADANLGIVGAGALATVVTTEELDPTSAATTDGLAVGTATDQASTATIADETLATPADVLVASAAIDQATEALADATPEATADGLSSTAPASDTASAPATVVGELATQETPAASLKVDASAASITVTQPPAGAAGSDTTLQLDRVVAPQNGWVAIARPNADGTPNFGAVLGTVPVQAGENTNVQVPLSEALGAGGAVAVLLTDEGVAGTFEPNGADLPVTAGGTLVAANVAGSAAAATGTEQTATSSAGVEAPSNATVTSDTMVTGDTSTTEELTATAEPATTTEGATTAAPAVTVTTDAITATNQAAATAAAQEATTAAATAEPIVTAEPTNAASAAPTAAPTSTVEPAQTFTATTEATTTTAPSATAAVEPTATPAPTAMSAAVPTATGAANGSGAGAAAQPTAPSAAGVQEAAQQSVVVNDPFLFGNTAAIDQVTTGQNGWVVLQRIDANGQPIPDAIVGVAPVQAGTTSNVQVPLSAALAPGDKVVVLLHADAGAAGRFEYPGPDTRLRNENSAPVLTVRASAQLPDTGTLAGLWMAVLVAALVVCVAGVMLRQHLVR